MHFFIPTLLIFQSQYRAGIAEVIVYACPEFPDTNVYQFQIPPTLRMPYPPHILQQLSSSLPAELFIFRLVPFSPIRTKCSGEEKKSVELNIRNNYTAGIKRDKLTSTLHLYSGTLYYFTLDGFLKAGKFFYQPLHYCIAGITPQTINVRICAQPPNFRILPKCCPLGMIMKLNLNVRGSKVGCTLVVYDWNPSVFPNISTLMSGKASVEVGHQFDYQHKILGQCPDMKTLSVSPSKGNTKVFPQQKQMRILESGEVYTRESGNHAWEHLKYSFCMDGLVNTAESPDSYDHRTSHTNQIILACEPSQAGSSTVYSLIYFCGYTISGLVSLLIFLAYVMIWTQQNVHGWTVAMLALSLCLNSVFIAAGHGYGLWGVEVEPTPPCIGVGIMAHFFYVASFAWMTVLNYDLFTTLTSLVPTSKKSKGKKLFAAYSLFAFVIPTIVVTISIILETQYSLFDDRVIRPQYGRVVCHLDKSAELYHSVIVNAILVAINILLALLTTTYLLRAQKSTSDHLRSTRRSRSKGLLLGRLLAVMGVSWTFDVLSWFVSGAEVKWYWVISDLYNCAQSLILFWIFIINASGVRKQLLEKLHFMQVVRERLGGTESQRPTGSETRSDMPLDGGNAD